MAGQWEHWIAVRAVAIAVRRGARDMGNKGGGRDWKEVSVEYRVCKHGQEALSGVDGSRMVGFGDCMCSGEV